MEHPPDSPDLDPSDFWLFSKIVCLKQGRRLQDIEDIKNVTATESSSTTGIQKMFPTVAASLD
jgi:hypothetical protein